MNLDVPLKLWTLLVGDSNSSDTLLNYVNLTTVIKFAETQTLTQLINNAYQQRSSGILKDRFVSAWLIDRLRTGLGWEMDLQLLNAEISTVLKHIEVFRETMLTETTIVICLLECFSPFDFASRSRLFDMINKCNMSIPLTARISQVPSHLYVNVAFLQYQMDLFKRLVLCFGSDSMNGLGKDTLIRRIFPGISLKDETDDIRSTTIELINLRAETNDENLHVLNVNGPFDSQMAIIDQFASICNVLVFSVNLTDINEDGTLNIKSEQKDFLFRYREKLIFVVRNVDQKMMQASKLLNFWKQNTIADDNQYCLDDLTKQEKLIYKTIKEKLREHIFDLLRRPVQSNNIDLIQLQINILQKQPDSESNQTLIYHWHRISEFIRETRQILNMSNNTKNILFPFSAVAEQFKTSKEENYDRRNPIAQRIDSKQDLTSEYGKVINLVPSTIIRFALDNLRSIQYMYLFENEIQSWKIHGEIYQLRKRISELQIIRNSIETSSNKNVSSLIKRLDSIEWGPFDLWREFRLIRYLIHENDSLSRNQKRILTQNYPLLAEKSNSMENITNRYSTLFFAGFPVDAIDGTLLEYDHKFMENAFNRNICEILRGKNEQSFFVISVLGTQSTGKSTLLNNLFGCDMPVSAGRTTRGENVTCIRVDIPDCSIKNIIVQDFEGLMTMERGGSVFDKSICLFALATSDLVLLNTSRVIDAPTQELLKYVMFAFYHLGLQEYRKPKMTFVLRDMASDDLTEFSSITKRIGDALISYFQTFSDSIQLTDILSQIKYMALASALHRQHPEWEKTFSKLRNHIFENIQTFSMNIPDDHRNWLNWINVCNDVWIRVRNNLNLLDANTLNEMQFKERMDQCLNEVIDSYETFEISETKMQSEINVEIEKFNENIDLERFDKEIRERITLEFKQCEEQILKIFADKIQTVPTDLISAYEKYKSLILNNVIQQYKDDAIVRLKEKYENVAIKKYLDFALERLISKVEDRISKGSLRSERERKQEFDEFWSTEKTKIFEYKNKSNDETNLVDRINFCYRIITMNNHRHQPNDLDQLLDENATDFENIPMEKCLIIPDPGVLNRAKHFFRSNSTTSKNEYFHLIQTLTIQFIDQILNKKRANFGNLNRQIRNFVFQLNEFIERWNNEILLDLQFSLSAEFSKAAHRFLYLKITNYYQEEKFQKQNEFPSWLNQRKEILYEKYLFALRKIDENIQTANRIVEYLQHILLDFATDKENLNLQSDNIDEIVNEFFDEIETPKKLFNICYQRTFIQEDEDETLDFLDDRNDFLERVWQEYFDQGKSLLCEKKIQQALEENYIALSRHRSSKFDILQTEVDRWFEENRYQQEIDGKSLMDHLKNHRNLRRIFVSSSWIDRLRNLSIENVARVHHYVKTQWNFDEQKEDLRNLVEEAVNDCYDEIRDRTFGCSDTCPFCDTKCSKVSNHDGKHYCHMHLISGFSERFKTSDDEIAHWYCQSDRWDIKWVNTSDSSSISYPFGEYLKKYYPEWTIEKASSPFPPNEQRDMFRKLNDRLATRYNRKPNRSARWLRDRVTVEIPEIFIQPSTIITDFFSKLFDL